MHCPEVGCPHFEETDELGFVSHLGYFAKEENLPDDNPPIGIILSHYKDDLLVEYATYGICGNYNALVLPPGIEPGSTV